MLLQASADQKHSIFRKAWAFYGFILDLPYINKSLENSLFSRKFKALKSSKSPVYLLQIYKTVTQSAKSRLGKNKSYTPFPPLMGMVGNYFTLWTVLSQVHGVDRVLSPTFLTVQVPSRSFPFPLGIWSQRALVPSWKWKWKSLCRVRLFATPWTIQSMEFSRPEYWSG